MIRHILSLLSLTLLLGFLTPPDPARAQGVADYRDVVEMNAAIDALNGALDGRVRVERIGRSEEGRDIKMLRLRQVGPRGTITLLRPKPALLVECAMHAREWASAETCMRMVEDFVALYPLAPVLSALAPNSQLARLPALLDRVDVLVVPMVNPDGRVFDDTDGGNPFEYGPGIGWRKNRGIYPCAATGADEVGIDLSRNFSVGWDDGDAIRTCSDRKYRGPEPFAAKENRVMRRLVHNELVAQSYSVHGNGQSLNRTLSPGFASAEVQTLVDLYNNAAVHPDLVVGNGAGGGGNGQFTSWASGTSDNPGAPDEGTRRGINAYLMELPVRAYNGSVYRLNQPGRQHGFRPTSAAFLEDMRAPMLATFLQMINQASEPWRVLDPFTGAAPACSGSGCRSDMALVGSRIVHAPGNFVHQTRTGALRMSNAPDPHEYLRPSRYAPMAGVQNASQSGGSLTRTVRFSVSRRPTGNSGGWTTLLFQPSDGPTHRSVTLAPGDISFVSGPRFSVLDGYEYRVTIFLDGVDDEARNDRHVYRFRGHN